MDYDQTAIAASYDAARSYTPQVLQQWLDVIAAHIPLAPAAIVDVGCGTGRYTHALAERFCVQVIGIDPSEKMLEIARSKPCTADVEFRRGSGEHLPLAEECADVVFLSMVLHHLTDRARAASECRRVLRRSGRVCVRNSTRWSSYPAHRFFPGALAMIDELPARDDIIAMFENAGLQLKAYRLVSHVLALGWEELADKLALRADSFLARLPDAEFAAGMVALRAHARSRPRQEAVLEDIDFFVFGDGAGRSA
jgi:SAM-dependent methyltransferase